MSTHQPPRTDEKICGMGHSMKRKEDPRFIRGQGNYIDDIKLPGMVYGALLRSPYAHARIVSIDTSNCGACVVHVDGKPVKSCTMLAAMAEGHEVRTVESLEVDGVLDPVQQGFHELHALQCGFCTPGMLMTARALLDRNPDPTEQEIRTAISGGICRCTGYKNIVAAIRWAAEHEAAARQGVTV